METPEFRDSVSNYDISIYQEVCLHEDVVYMAGDVDGYTRFSRAREYVDEDADQRGGVVVFAREELGLAEDKRLSSPDILVLANEDVVVVGAYILPERSSWATFTQVDPFERLVEVMVALQSDTRSVLLMGDMNARTRDMSGGVSPRVYSVDAVPRSVRGAALVQACSDNGFTIMNGLERFGEGSGAYTLYHTVGKSVVDYAIGNGKALGEVRDVTIGVEDHEWSDHVPVIVRIEVGKVKGVESGGLGTGRDRTRKTPRRKPKLPDNTELDRLVIRALESRLDPALRLRRLYGSAYHKTCPIQVYVDGSSMNNGRVDARAGSGMFFGRDSRKNAAVRVPDDQTNNRAEAFAILRAIEACHPHQTLDIYSDSEYAINSLTTWASGSAAVGWRVRNGDVFGDIAHLLRMRPAGVTLHKVKAHSGHAANDAADALAKEGALLPPAPPYVKIDRSAAGVCVCDACAGKTELVALDKVVGLLGKRRGEEADKRGRWEETDEQAAPSLLTDRRRKCRARQREIREDMFGGAVQKKFWRVFERLTGGGAGVVGEFSADVLGRSFCGKMNPPAVPHHTFDQDRMRLLEHVAATLGDVTEDTTPDRSFSRRVVVEEIEKGKKVIKGKFDSATGADGISYRDIYEMDNDLLVELVNLCFDTRDAPSIWLRTQIVGLCKKGKPKDDPDSYRTIGLESCLLKFTTLIASRRFVEFGEGRGIIPDSQNGFRAEYRTNNNVFVLRAATDKARAEGRPLYAAFVDLTNAFPSTNHAALWLKLRRHGAGGKIFDWLRWLYGAMTYVATHNGEDSEAFEAAMGILIGDTCSPVLWALYMSDLPDFIPKDGDDIVLGGTAVTNVEQADDVLLMSSTPEGLLRKLRAMFRWCQKNFLLFNTVKSVVMIFGKQPRDLPVFDLGEGGVLEVVREHTYLGFQISSSGSGMMRLHYNAKEATAKTVSRVIWVVQQLSGAMPVAMLTMLYMALVDPHLVHGCEVVLDENAKARGLLEGVQKRFLRRVLGLGALSMVAVLFTETGLEPLRYRRILLAIDYLLYVLRSPCVYVRLALREIVDLDQRRYPTWVGSLRSVVQALPGQVEFPPPNALLLEARVERLRTDVERSMDRVLQGEVDGTDRLGLIHGRTEVDPDGGPARRVVRMRRHYPCIVQPRASQGTGACPIGGHNFATARRRYTHSSAWGLRCRFCEVEVESVEHVWLVCGADEALVRARREYIIKVVRGATRVEAAYIRSLNSAPSQQLRALLDLRSVTSATAEFAYVVQEIAEGIGLAPLNGGAAADAGLDGG